MTTTTDATRTAAAFIDISYHSGVDPFDGRPDDPDGGTAATKIWAEPGPGIDGVDVMFSIDRTNISLFLDAREARKLAMMLIAATDHDRASCPDQCCQAEAAAPED